MASLFSGAVFGAAMVAAGVYQPSTVISQFKLENWHMLQVMLIGTAGSAAIYSIAERLGYVKIQPRSSSPLGLFAKYDGNIVGGFLLGAGMALSASCPGTVLGQVGVGLQTGFYALCGALVGGVVWTGLISKLVKSQKERAGIKAETCTFNENIGLSRGATLVVFETTALAIVAATVAYSNGASDWSLFSAGSGIFIALAQLFSIVTRRSMLGVSSSYEEVGNYFWWLTKGADPKTKPSGYRNMLFAFGVATGARALVTYFPQFATETVFEAPPQLAVLGGVLMVVGSRIAGGCTSGHAISGLSLLSTSSLVTMMTALAAGVLIAPLVY
ncbi:Fc.00g091180.m01.CDS01 [Cosmosporella sp. VM-42]